MNARRRDFQDTFVAAHQTILDALRAIDNAALQVALVVDDNKTLVGTVTDGDVRRAILAGSPLDNPVSDIMNRKPVTARQSDGPDAILKKMLAHKIHRIPVLDDQGRVVGLHCQDTLLEQAKIAPPSAGYADVPVVLMLGGEGKRLHPLTETLPKPMLSVGGRPLLETIVRQFVGQGFRRFYFCVNYKADVICDHFGSGAAFDANIHYLVEPHKMGTAGALGLLPDAARGAGPLIVMNGDLLTNVNFAHMLDFHRQTHAIATMGVREYSHEIPYGIVQNNGTRLDSIVEKPSQSYFVNAGIYVLDPQALALIPQDAPLDMPQLFDRIGADGGESVVFPIREYWLDIGRFEDLERARAEYAGVFG